MNQNDLSFAKRFLSRRNLLGHTAMAALLMPVLRRLEAKAAETSPRRVIFVFAPNGPMTVTGPASGNETEFGLHEWWEPLERHKSRGLFMSHMAVTGTGVVSGNGHGLGGQLFSGYGAGWNGNQYANKGQTVDQVIGKRLEAEGRAGLVRSLVWGLAGTKQGGGTGEGFCAAPGRNIAPETNPSKAWAQLFARFMTPAPGADAQARAAALVGQDRSVLDFVSQDCGRMKTHLGSEGGRLLDDHCSTVRTLEKNLVNSLSRRALTACEKPAQPAALEWPKVDHIDEQMVAFVDLMAAALACELTHVIGFQFGGQAARNRLAEKYAVPSSPKADSGDSGPAHHPWTHQDASDEKTVALRIFQRFYSTQMALFIDKLASTKDAMGKPLLDSTWVILGSELGGNEKNDDPHQTGCLPVICFGSGQGTFKTGRYLRGRSKDVGSGGKEPGRDMAGLLLAAVHYMGLTDIKTLGATDVTSPWPALYA